MKKRAISIALAFVIIAAFFPVAPARAAEAQDVAKSYIIVTDSNETAQTVEQEIGETRQE